MKKIEAIIRKTKFEEVKEALLNSDIDWFEYHNVHGIGQSRQERIYRGVQYSTDVIERVALTIGSMLVSTQRIVISSMMHMVPTTSLRQISAMTSASSPCSGIPTSQVTMASTRMASAPIVVISRRMCLSNWLPLIGRQQ